MRFPSRTRPLPPLPLRLLLFPQDRHDPVPPFDVKDMPRGIPRLSSALRPTPKSRAQRAPRAPCSLSRVSVGPVVSTSA
jgi:hypothetical protein